MKKPNSLPALLLSFVFLITGCTSIQGPDLGGLYSRAAKHHDEDRNPVIVIPGVLGSKLINAETDQVVWGAFTGGAVNPKKAEGARLFALPMQEGVPLSQLRDTVVSDGALDRIRLSFFFLPISLSAYVYILRALGVGGYRDEALGESGAIDYGEDHFTCFQFDYDWRRDISENAKRLHEFILEKKKYVEAELDTRFGAKERDVKFDIVAHSMGGLVARYYLRYGPNPLPPDGSIPPQSWEGYLNVERVVLIGPPNAGSVQSLVYLVKGIKFGPFLPKYEPAILGTMPAVYQLLPRPRHKAIVQMRNRDEPVDIYDPAFWEEMGWGIVAEDQDDVLKKLLPDASNREERLQVARDHLGKVLARAKQFAEAMDSPSELPEGMTLYLFAGDAVKTDAVMAVDEKNGNIKTIQQGPGDKTVLRSSALMDERVGAQWEPRLISPIDWTNVVFLFKDHLGLTKDSVFIDNILYFLLEAQK